MNTIYHRSMYGRTEAQTKTCYECIDFTLPILHNGEVRLCNAESCVPALPFKRPLACLGVIHGR